MIGSFSPNVWLAHHPQTAVNRMAPRIQGQWLNRGEGSVDAPIGAVGGAVSRRDMVAVGACGDWQRRLSASVNLCPSFQVTRPGGDEFRGIVDFPGKKWIPWWWSAATLPWRASRAPGRGCCPATARDTLRAARADSPSQPAFDRRVGAMAGASSATRRRSVALGGARRSCVKPRLPDPRKSRK